MAKPRTMMPLNFDEMVMVPPVLKERKRPICGKIFFPWGEWGWKIGTEKNPRNVCSYTCMRVWEKSHKLQ